VSSTASAAAKADVWFNRYLALGEGRSIKLLIQNVQEACSRGGEAPPPERTLFSWSSHYGWDRRAKEHDTQLAARARDKVLRAQAMTAEERAGVALGTSMAFHALVRDALTHREPRMDPKDPEVQLTGIARLPPAAPSSAREACQDRPVDAFAPLPVHPHPYGARCAATTMPAVGYGFVRPVPGVTPRAVPLPYPPRPT